MTMNRRERERTTPGADDGIALAGGVLLWLGVWLTFGLGWSLIAVGVLLLGMALVGAMRR